MVGEQSVNCVNWKSKVDVVFVVLFIFQLKVDFSYTSNAFINIKSFMWILSKKSGILGSTN